MNSPTTTVLITGAGTATCQSVIKGLRASDAPSTRVLVVDSRGEAAGRYLADGFRQVPLANAPDFVPSLLEVCQGEGVDLLIPIVDHEFELIAEHRESFEALGCRVAISSASAIRICNDKWETYLYFSQLGVLTPRTHLADELPAELVFPQVVKPRQGGRASIDVYVAKDRRELDVFLARVPDAIVQSLASGTEHTIDVLCDFAGRVVNAVVRERIETKAGVSYRGRTVRDEAMIATAVTIVETLGLRGPSNIQCFRSGDEINFTEINPRFSGALALTIAAGFNSPACLVRLALGMDVQSRVGQFAPNVMMLRYWEEVFLDSAGSRLPAPWAGRLVDVQHAD